MTLWQWSHFSSFFLFSSLCKTVVQIGAERVAISLILCNLRKACDAKTCLSIHLTLEWVEDRDETGNLANLANLFSRRPTCLRMLDTRRTDRFWWQFLRKRAKLVSLLSRQLWTSCLSNSQRDVFKHSNLLKASWKLVSCALGNDGCELQQTDVKPRAAQSAF